MEKIEYILVLGSNLWLPTTDKNYLNILSKYGKTHKVEPVAGTEIDLTKLPKNQSVVWGDGKTYHFRLTKI